MLLRVRRRSARHSCAVSPRHLRSANPGTTTWIYSRATWRRRGGGLQSGRNTEELFSFTLSSNFIVACVTSTLFLIICIFIYLLKKNLFPLPTFTEYFSFRSFARGWSKRLSVFPQRKSPLEKDCDRGAASNVSRDRRHPRDVSIRADYNDDISSFSRGTAIIQYHYVLVKCTRASWRINLYPNEWCCRSL